MAAQIVKTNARTEIGDNTTTVLEYKVWDTFSKDEAVALLVATTPLLFDNLIFKTLTIDGGGRKDIWDCTAVYGLLAALTGDLASSSGSQFNFSIGGGTERITQSKETISSTATTGDATDHKGAIGVSRDSVEGVNIKVPIFAWSERHAIANSLITSAYIQTLKDVMNSPVNNASFRGSAAGEILIESITGTEKDQDTAELTFSFVESKNATNLTVGGITGIDKEGWHYLWTEYEDVEDTTSNTIAKRAKAVYVERVYDSSNFADLGIGTA